MSHPGVEPQWPTTVRGPSTHQIGFECPQCFRLVMLTPTYLPDASGALLLDAPPMVRAMSIHMRVGCTRR